MNQNIPDWKCRLEFLGRTDLGNPSCKFWQAEVYGKVFVRRWGRIGTAGGTKREVFFDSFGAKQAALKMVNKKRSEGYTNEVDIVTLIGTLFDEEAA